VIRELLKTSFEVRIKEKIRNEKTVLITLKSVIENLTFDFTIFELKSLIKLVFSVNEKINQIKEMLKSFELYKYRPLSFIKFAKFPRQKYVQIKAF
jgi:hypothetical protein